MRIMQEEDEVLWTSLNQDPRGQTVPPIPGMRQSYHLAIAALCLCFPPVVRICRLGLTNGHSTHPWPDRRSAVSGHSCGPNTPSCAHGADTLTSHQVVSRSTRAIAVFGEEQPPLPASARSSVAHTILGNDATPPQTIVSCVAGSRYHDH